MGRAPCCEKVGLRKGRWTAEEDEMLKKYIEAHGEGSWRSLPRNAGLLRCGKSCRLRWINYLRADVKRGNITHEEEETIIKLHASLGNRWSAIAGHLPGRTDNEIKNYWNSHLSRKISSFGRSGSDTKPVAVNPGKVASKRKGGRPSRPAKKNQKQQKQQSKDESSTRSVQSEQGESVVIDLYGPQQASSVNEGEGVGPCGDGPMSPPSEGNGAHGVKEGEVGAMGVNGGGDKVVALNEWVDWDLEGLEGKLWDGVGEAWPLGWGGESEYHLDVDTWLYDVL